MWRIEMKRKPVIADNIDPHTEIIHTNDGIKAPSRRARGVA